MLRLTRIRGWLRFVLTAVLLLPCLAIAGDATESRPGQPAAKPGTVAFGVALDGDVYVQGASVYERPPDGEWVLVQELSSQSPGLDVALFGISVAVDGDTIAVGAALQIDPGEPAGVVAYVFHRSQGGAWTEQARLVMMDQWYYEDARVALDLEEDVLVVGAPADLPFSPGHVYIFERDAGDTWVPLTDLYPPSGTWFGSVVEMNDGLLLIAGHGAAFVYEVEGDTLALDATLSAGGASPIAAAVRDDRIAIGAANGRVYVFDRTPGESWMQEAELAPIYPTQQSSFGRAVALESGLVIVGYPDGKLLLFDEYEGVWAPRGEVKDLPSPPEFVPADHTYPPLAGPRLTGRLDFRKPDRDTLRLRGDLVLPPGWRPLDQEIHVNLGGVRARCTLNKKGKARNAVSDIQGHGQCRVTAKLRYRKKLDVWKLDLKLKKGRFLDDLADEGATNADTMAHFACANEVRVTGMRMFADTAGVYRGKAGKRGKLRMIK